MSLKHIALTLGMLILVGASAVAYQASLIPSSRLIQCEELAKILRSPKAAKPLVLQVGPQVLYTQAHIPGAEHIAPAFTDSSLQQLRKRVEPLARNKFIVIYCGCCPWDRCPNVEPADRALRAMGFSQVKILYIPDNFGHDWVDKGYPVAKGD